MTKEELIIYISEAVDALDAGDLELLFPANNQPDLYTIVEELTGLKGTLNKLSGSNLKLNHEIHSLVEQVTMQQQQQPNAVRSLSEEKETNASDAELKSLLLQLLEMDELIRLTAVSFQELPKLNKHNKKKFKPRFASWQKGFAITIDRWGKLLQSNNLYETGLVGETFDPELHEAVAVKQVDDLASNIILETEQTGFLYKGQVIRLAKVVVNKKKGTTEIGTIPIDRSETADSTTSLQETTAGVQTEVKKVVKKSQKRKKSSKRKQKEKKKKKKEKRKKK